MKAIKKLKIIFRVAMLSILISFFLFKFKSNIGWGIAFIVLLIIFILSRLIFFRNKNIYYENYSTIPLYYMYGGVFLFFAIIFSLFTILDLKNGSPTPLWAILALSGAWIFGILLIYYTYQAKKESLIKSRLKPKKKIEIERIKKFNIYRLMAFLIIATIISFVFKLIPFKLVYILISFLIMIFMFTFLRITFSKL